MLCKLKDGECTHLPLCIEVSSLIQKAFNLHKDTISNNRHAASLRKMWYISVTNTDCMNEFSASS